MPNNGASGQRDDTRAPRNGPITANRLNPIRKSTPAASWVPSTGTSRGKYILRSSAPSVSSALAPNDTPFCTKVQPTSVAREKAAYGPPPPDTPPSRPRAMVKIAMNASGWSTAHRMPSAVCLYLTRTSRSANARTVSRYAHVSLSACPILGRARTVTTSSGTPIRGISPSSQVHHGIICSVPPALGPPAHPRDWNPSRVA